MWCDVGECGQYSSEVKAFVTCPPFIALCRKNMMINDHHIDDVDNSESSSDNFLCIIMFMIDRIFGIGQINKSMLYFNPFVD